ncbi:MAG: NAD-dependent epimerase/dehydratase family protein [Alicyclobacillaceae bacterium]|nr:NAD-dependent epimerase/dehydratase family protein [Alicyclobacillaceae bacterium]
MRVLLVGGSKLIGYYLLPLLVREGHDVTVISRGNRPLNETGVTHIKADRTELFTLPGFSGVYDVVIDNVAYTPEDCKNLLASMRGRLNHYIVTSTVFVYPNVETALKEPSRPIRETDALFNDAIPECQPANEHEEYVYNKRRMEHWLCHNSHQFDVKTTVIRPYFQIVGPNTADGRFAWFWLRVKDGGPIWLPDELIHKAGPCQLAFSGDVARVILAALNHPPQQYAVYNATQPELWTYEEYIRLMATVAGTTPKIHYAPRQVLNEWAGGTYKTPLPYCVPVDVSKAELDLGVSFTSMATWIRETGEWMTEFYQDSTPSWYRLRNQEQSWIGLGVRS